MGYLRPLGGLNSLAPPGGKADEGNLSGLPNILQYRPPSDQFGGGPPNTQASNGILGSTTFGGRPPVYTPPPPVFGGHPPYTRGRDLGGNRPRDGGDGSRPRDGGDRPRDGGDRPRDGSPPPWTANGRPPPMVTNNYLGPRRWDFTAPIVSPPHGGGGGGGGGNGDHPGGGGDDGGSGGDGGDKPSSRDATFGGHPPIYTPPPPVFGGHPPQAMSLFPGGGYNNIDLSRLYPNSNSAFNRLNTGNSAYNDPSAALRALLSALNRG